MPTAQLKQYAKEAGVSVEKAERAWEKAKEQADKSFKINEGKARDGHYWAYVNIVTQRKLGIEKESPKQAKDKKKEAKKK